MGTGVLDQLAQAVDGLAGVDPDTLSDAELDELVVGLQRVRHRLDAAAAGLQHRWVGCGVWASDGSRSPAARLARDASMSPARARRELRRAEQLAAMPVVAEAVGAGRLSMDHVDLLAGADAESRHEAFVRDEVFLVEQCERLRFAQAVQLVDYWKLRVDATGCEDEAQRRVDAAHLHASTTFEGNVRIDGQLDPISGAIVQSELDRLTRQLHLADQQAGVTRTAAQRRAAALVEMATRSASTPDGARRPAPLFTVVVGDDSFGHLCELANGTVVAPGLLVPYLDRALLETILFADPLTILGVSQRRSFTGRLRRAIEIRARHCEHPSGCDEPASRCDVDHIRPYSEGGVTSQFNGRLECWKHNRHPDFHDHDAEPLPEREITQLDQLRALIRWRQQHDGLDDPDTDDPDTDDDVEDSNQAEPPPAASF